ncbi:hypothetical protein C494_14933, partial [Natronorubrum bangense JCM 10635]
TGSTEKYADTQYTDIADSYTPGQHHPTEYCSMRLCTTPYHEVRQTANCIESEGDSSELESDTTVAAYQKHAPWRAHGVDRARGN